MKYVLGGGEPEPAHTLFFATTSYQILLAHLLAQDRNICPEKSVLLVKRRLGNQIYSLFDALSGDGSIPFEQLFLLDRPKAYKRHQRAWSDRRRRADLRGLIDQINPSQLFIFNEDPLDQDAARRVKASGGRVFAVEDGAIAYADTERTITLGEGLKDKFFFGPRTRRTTVEGSSPLVDAVYAVYPGQLRRELRHKPAYKIPGTSAASFQDLRWPGLYLQRLGLDIERIRCDCLFMLARSNNFRGLTDYSERMIAALEHPWTAHGHHAIKYHPNEKRRDLLNAENLGFSVIDNAVPAELIYLAAGDRLRAVVGDIGTSLLSARWLLPGVRAVSLMRYLNFNDPSFAHTLRQIDVELPAELPRV